MGEGGRDFLHNFLFDTVCAHLIIDLCDLNEDRERQAEEQVANHRPAAAKVLMYSDGRHESLPRVFISKHYQRQ